MNGASSLGGAKGLSNGYAVVFVGQYPSDHPGKKNITLAAYTAYDNIERVMKKVHHLFPPE
jgi:hypothetical protein